jgi:hypothetical protein
MAIASDTPTSVAARLKAVASSVSSSQALRVDFRSDANRRIVILDEGAVRSNRTPIGKPPLVVRKAGSA